MPIDLETVRLYMREMCGADAQNFFELNNDPEVLKYTGEQPYPSLDHALEFIKGYQQYRKYNMGRLSLFLKESDEYLGWCGLKHYDLPRGAVVDLGYRLMKKHWGKGYATEAAIANINYGFRNINLDKIEGWAFADNKASRRIFDKLGLTYLQDTEFDGNPGVIYAITKDKWK